MPFTYYEINSVRQDLKCGVTSFETGFPKKPNRTGPCAARSYPALPAQPETPNDGHLAGLLTYASLNLKRLPGSSQWHVAQVLSEYSCGAVAESHRASQYQMERSYIRLASTRQEPEEFVIW